MAAAAASEALRDQPGARAAGIELRGATKRFVTPTGTAFTALNDFSLKIEPGQFCAVVGPTGCGKSTTLDARLRPRPSQRRAA